MICPPGHKHGLTSTCYGNHGCRCDDCTIEARAYMARRRELVKQGTWDARVDAGETIAHLRRLTAAGMTAPEIAAAARVSETTIYEALAGKRPRFNRTTARALHAVTTAHRRARPSTLGAARRVGALLAQGYSLAHISNVTGIGALTLADIARDRWASIMPATFAAIDAAYRRLAYTPHRPDGRHPRSVATKARRLAAELGHVPAAAWDDIDDPHETPSIDVHKEAS